MSDYDGPDFIVRRQRRARVSHRCCDCRRTIHRGDVYEHSVGKWNCVIDAFRRCVTCVEIADAVLDVGCDVGFGSLYENASDAILSGYHGDPKTIGRLAGLLFRAAESRS